MAVYYVTISKPPHPIAGILPSKIQLIIKNNTFEELNKLTSVKFQRRYYYIYYHVNMFWKALNAQGLCSVLAVTTYQNHMLEMT